MNRSTEWFISGALAFGTVFFLWMEKSSAEQQAFWFGTSYMPPIQVAIMRLSIVMIPALIIFGIVSIAMGLKNSGVITVERDAPPESPATSTVPTFTQGLPVAQNEIVAKEIVMAPCEYCRALIPKISVFCPNCGTKRD